MKKRAIFIWIEQLISFMKMDQSIALFQSKLTKNFFSKKFKKLTSMKALQPFSSCMLFGSSPADANFSPSCLA